MINIKDIFEIETQMLIWDHFKHYYRLSLHKSKLKEILVFQKSALVTIDVIKLIDIEGCRQGLSYSVWVSSMHDWYQYSIY